MRALLYAPGGGAVGVGHTMRSLALAEEALARGWTVALSGVLEGPAMAHARLIPGLQVVGGGPEDLRARAAAGFDVLHLDTYEVQVPELEGPSILVSSMVDGHFGLRAAHLAIDTSPGAPSRVDRIRTITGGEALVGPGYVPLRGTVRRLAGGWTGSGARRSQVLVVMGGTDPFGLAPQVVDALAQTSRIDVTVVCPANRHGDLQHRWRSKSGTLTCLAFVNDLASMALQYDLVVSASGISVWEFAVLGVPMALICGADNQVDNFDALVRHKAAIGLLAPLNAPAEFASRVLAAVRCRDELERISETAKSMVDVFGASRVVKSWEALIQQPSMTLRDDRVTIRRAERADSENLYEWRNDEATRRFSRNSTPVNRASHQRWFEALLMNPDRHILIAEVGGHSVGTVRWDAMSSAPWEGRWEVSITVAPTFRGRGLARSILTSSEDWLSQHIAGPMRLLASVHATNHASARVFAQAGYLPDLDADDSGFFRLSRSVVGLSG